MSLIHEALKRAEADKLRRAGANVPVLPPPLPPRAVRRKGPAMAAFLTILLVAAAVVGGVSLLRKFAGAPRTSVAAVAEKPGPVQSLAVDPAKSKIDASLAAAANATKLVQAAQARTVEALAAEARTGVDPITAPETEPAQAVVVDNRGGEVSRIVNQPVDAAPKPDDKESVPGLTLSGIMSGPGGDAALINGQMVQVGETVGGAKLIRVLYQAVELQVGDRQVVLRM